MAELEKWLYIFEIKDRIINLLPDDLALGMSILSVVMEVFAYNHGIKSDVKCCC